MIPAAPSPPAGRDRGLFQRVLEALALLTLLAALSLYFIGRVFASRFLEAFGQQDLGAGKTWDLYVFQGFGAVIDTLTQAGRPGFRAWILFLVLAALAALAARAAFSRLERPWLRWPLSLGAGYLAVLFAFAMLMRLAVPWADELASQVKAPGRTRHHFVFQDSARGAFPEALFAANEAGRLRVIEETPEFVLLYAPGTISGTAPEGARVYRVPVREIRLHEVALPSP